MDARKEVLSLIKKQVRQYLRFGRNVVIVVVIK